jgi:hypothetical protein
VHDDDLKFDEFLKSAAKDYKSAPAPRTDVMWSAIEGDVAQAIQPGAKVRSIRVLRTSTWIGLGIAATLMLGVAIGRWSNRATTEQQVAKATAPARLVDDSSGRAAHTRATTMAHLADAEVFLTSVRADLKAGRSDAERTERSRELLVRTRLLLGNSAATSPEIARLLQDLELLLAEIAATPAARSPIDQKLLDESMRDGNVIPRIRATLPATSVGT